MGNKKSRMAREAKEAKQDSERFKDSLAVVITFWLEMGNTPDKRDAMVVSLPCYTRDFIASRGVLGVAEGVESVFLESKLSSLRWRCRAT